MTTPNTNTSNCDTGANYGTKVPFENITEPGCYFCHWSGHLLRVPEDGVTPGRSPLINMVGNEPLYVTKISDNPYVAITKAKMIACNWDLNVNF